MRGNSPSRSSATVALGASGIAPTAGAELQAMVEEQRTYENMRAKQERIQNFNKRTATAAQRKLKEEQKAKKLAED